MVANKKRGSYLSSCPAPSCPSWARAEGDLLGSTRTLLIQSGRENTPNSSNLLMFTRVRGTRRWSLLGFMLDFAMLYSLIRVATPTPPD